MTPDQTQTIRKIIAEQYCVPVEMITLTTTLGDLGDSLGYMELVMWVEDELEIQIDDDALPYAPDMTVEQFVAGVGQFLPGAV